MKSAEKWLKERCVPEAQSESQPLWSDCIKAIQRDARLDGKREGLLEAAKIIRERYRVTSGLGYLSPALRKCFQAIEAEAQKLK